MNTLHRSILRLIRESAQNTEIGRYTDERLCRLMFSNYRGLNDEAKGLRLTGFGLTLMSQCFESYRTHIRQQSRVGPKELLYLDRHLRLPYYITPQEITVFDHDLGVVLALVEGDVSAVMRMDGN